MKRRWLCALLALMLCVGLLPMTALAASEEPAAAEPVEEAEEAAAEAAEDEAGESESAASEEPAAEAVALANVETEAPALDGDTAGYAAVTGDAVIENGMLRLYGLFTKPETEEPYRCFVRLYQVGWTEEQDVHIETWEPALDEENIGNTWELSGSYSLFLPGSTYYFYAGIEDAEGNIIARGDEKSFVTPMDGVETIQVGQTVTLPDEGMLAYYNFTPTADAVYALKLNKGYAYVSVYDSTGEVKAFVWRDEEMPELAQDYAAFTGKSGQTYCIEASSFGTIASSFTLSKEGDVTAFEAVTGTAVIEGEQVTIDGSFTKPVTTELYGCMILLGLSEADVAANKTTGQSQIGFDSKQWSNKSGSKNVADLNLLIPGLTYYYCAAIQNNGEWDIVTRGDIKSFVAPQRSFDTIAENTIKNQSQYHVDYSFTADGGTYELKVNDGEGYVEVYDSTGESVAFSYIDGDWESETEFGCFTARAGETYYVCAWNYLETAIRFSVNCTAPAHTWDSGVVTTEPTCTTKGVKTFTCSDCGETKTEDIPALGHDWDEGTVTTDPTCTEKGVKTYTCTVCDDTKTEEIAMLDHSWDEGVVTREPTVKEEGEKTFTCSVCGGTKTEEIARLTVAEALEDISEETAPEEIRDAVQEIGEETLSEAMSGKDSAEVIEQIKELEEKVDGSFTVVVTEEAAEAGVSDQVTVVGARLNDLKETGAEIVLTIDAAKEALTLPSGLSDENDVYLEITLTGVADPSALTVPVYLTLAVPEAMDAQKVRLVHYGANGTEVLLPVQLVEGEDGVWYASFVVSSFSPFALAEVVKTNTTTGGSATGTAKAHSPKTGDESNLVLWASILLVACGAAVVVVSRKRKVK